MSDWTITVPEASTNLVIDPECTALTFYNADGAGVTVDTTYARFGTTALKVVSLNVAADEGFLSDTLAGGMPVTAGTSYTLSGYMRGSGTVYMIIVWQNAGATIGSTPGATITLSNTRWTRYTVTGAAPAGSVTAVLIIYTKTKQAATWYVDGLQFEAKAYATTFISGNQPGCIWAGLHNESTSSRDAQYRLGGREVDLETTYGAKVLAPRGIGVPPVQNNLQTLALQPGAMFQSYKLMPRYIDLIVSTQVSIPADSMTTLHTRRDSLISLFAPDQYRGAQALRLGYTGAGRTVYGDYHYDGGLEFTDLSGRNESIPLRLMAVDPLLYEDDQSQGVLNVATILSGNNYAAARIAGTWQNMGTGFSGPVYAIEYDNSTGRVYFGGLFATANGVTVNNICVWNGTTFVAMNNGTNGFVRTLRVAPNGDLWVGGDFTAVNGNACKGLARFNLATGTWTAFNPAATFTSIYSITITNGKVYIGGNFTNWDGIAAADYIAQYDGSAWSAVGTGANEKVYTLDSYAGIVFAGGLFTSMGGVANTNYIAYWNGSAWKAITTGMNGSVLTLVRSADGVLYVGGNFTTAGGIAAVRAAKYDGSSWSALGSGFDSLVNKMISSGYTIYAFGDFAASGSLSVIGGAFWNGYAWTGLDMQINTGESVITAAINPSGDLFVGRGSNTDIVAAGITDVPNNGSTIAHPVITLSPIIVASAACSLRYIENQSTGQVIYFNLPLTVGEKITIDLSPGKKSITSSWSGRLYDNPLANSDFANFHLVPGTNRIACFITFASNIPAIMDWRTQHLSVDGAV